MAESSSPAQRKPPRTRVLMTAVLFTRDGAQRVRVQDLSAEGARLLTEAAVSEAEDAIFRRGGLFAAGRIAWSAPGRAGLSFYRGLSEAELESAFNSAADRSADAAREITARAAPFAALRR